eukprot:PhF_6_TR25588/c1_g1_i5/m.35882
MLMISFLVLTVLLIAPLQTNAQRCLSPTSYDTTLVLVTNTSNTDIDCLGSTSLNLRQLDAMPEYTPCSVNSTWGPYSVLFPKANIPSQCNPVTWARKRAVEVAANIVSKKYNYCHHHTATWTPPNDTIHVLPSVSVPFLRNILNNRFNLRSFPTMYLPWISITAMPKRIGPSTAFAMCTSHQPQLRYRLVVSTD